MHHIVRTLSRVSVMMALAGGTVLLAQEPDAYDYFVKARGQFGFKNDEGQRTAYGLGAGINLPMGGGWMGLALDYTSTPGGVFQETIPQSAGATQANSSWTSKHTGTLIALRISWLQPFAEGWYWQLGAGVGAGKDSLDSVGNFKTPVYTGSTTGGVWNTTTSTSGLAYQPYVGIVWKVAKAHTVEVNLVDVVGKRQEVVPKFHEAGFLYNPPHDVEPAYATSTYNDLRLELGYTFHF